MRNGEGVRRTCALHAASYPNERLGFSLRRFWGTIVGFMSHAVGVVNWIFRHVSGRVTCLW